MKSHTSLVAQQTRLSEWADMVRDCQNRPQGMKIDEWCQLHDITKASYYWRLRKVREAYLETADHTQTFVEVPSSAIQPVNMAAEYKIVAVIRGRNNLTLEITEQASDSFLKTLLGCSAMLNDGSGFKKVYLATGFTDLRRGIDGLARIIRFQFQLDPYDKNTLFLFCGKRTDRIKGLIWEGDGFLLLYKRIENGNFRWPRTQEDALEISADQYQMLMQGLEIVARHPIEEIPCPEFSL